MIDNPPHSLGWGWKLAPLVPLVAIGAGFRLHNLTAWPTVFHPMLQYENAVTTRVIWLKMRESSLSADEAAWLQHWNGRFKAPPVIETLTALSYLPDGTERIWVSALLTALVWLAGTWFLFDLARRFSGSDLGGVLAAGFYLILPFGIAVSRSFQHEALMVAAGLVGLWCLVRFQPAASLRGTAWVGLTCGLLTTAKPGIFGFVLGAAYFGLALGTRGLRRTFLSPQLWLFAALLAMPSLAYAFFFLHGESHQLIPALLLRPVFYRGWATRVDEVVGWPALGLAVLGAALALRRSGPPRFFAPALLLGYVLYGMVFTYAAATHNYYSVPLIPAVAICLAPIAGPLALAGLWARAGPLARSFVVLTLAGLAFLWVWASVATRRLQQEPDEALAPVYRHAGSIVGPGQSVLSLSWHYGFPLTFHGWVVAHHWGYAMDRPLMETYYDSAASNDDDRLTRMMERFHPTHFVITRLDEWEKQPGLRQALNSRFALCYKDDALIVYDLHRRPEGGAGAEERQTDH